MFVYVIVNDVNLKIYVGKHQGNSLKKYFQTKISDALHQRGGSSRLFAAIRKYGREHFHIYPLFEAQTNETISEHEKLLIKSLKTQHPAIGYNICHGGEGFSGPHTEASRQKISAAAKTMWLNPEIRDTIASKLVGIQRSPEMREKMRREWDLHHSRIISPQMLERLRDSHIGLHRSEESCQKQAESVSGTANHFYGKTHSEKTKAKMREKRASVQYHSNCNLHGCLSVATPHSKCPQCPKPRKLTPEESKQLRRMSRLGKKASEETRSRLRASHPSKLPSDVIHKILESGKTQQALADCYGVAQATIGRIKRFPELYISK